jgi:hypothetical protein
MFLTQHIITSHIYTSPLHLLHLPEIPLFVTNTFCDLYHYVEHLPTIVMSNVLTP